MNTPSHTAKVYLDAYARKDLPAIEGLLAADVVLRDWNLRVLGKAAVLRETEANFAQAQSLQIDVLRLHETANSVAAELRILVNGDIELFVVDVFEFNASGQLCAVRAYKGRGDAESTMPPSSPHASESP